MFHVFPQSSVDFRGPSEIRGPGTENSLTNRPPETTVDEYFDRNCCAALPHRFQWFLLMLNGLVD